MTRHGNALVTHSWTHLYIIMNHYLIHLDILNRYHIAKVYYNGLYPSSYLIEPHAIVIIDWAWKGRPEVVFRHRSSLSLPCNSGSLLSHRCIPHIARLVYLFLTLEMFPQSTSSIEQFVSCRALTCGPFLLLLTSSLISIANR